MNKWVLVLVLLGGVLALWVLGFGQSLGFNALTGPSTKPLSPESVATYEPLTIQYIDSELGFSVRHPIGYIVDAIPGEHVHFFASSPSGFSEDYLFKTTNETLSFKDLREIAVELEAKPVREDQVNVNGKTALRLQAVLPGDELLESETLVLGVIPCPGYRLYFTAVIPDSLSDDVALADYVLQTAQC
ncbi:hypothetical protein HY572_04265 [Candidatus Micrarchaeota archaeon]|nr:hypothetical protein [Candidatus Micrarchaeota archaeon]